MELNIQFNDLFPTRIWQVDLNGLAAHFPAWIAEVARMREAAPVPAGRSNRLGWNSADKAVLERPAFAVLHEVVRVSCTSVFDQMRLAAPRFRLEAWINMHDRGGFNFQHMHDGALLSGVFYLQVPAGSGALVLQDPRPKSVAMGLPVGAANAIADLHLEPKSGLLVMFPYWLEHHVEPHESDTPRIAVPFNALRD